jgi:chromosome segregation ATPase
MPKLPPESEPPEPRASLYPRELPEYPGPVYDPESTDVVQLQKLVTVRETQLQEYVTRTQALEEQQTTLRTSLEQSEQARVAAESQIPILRERIDLYLEDTEALRARIADLEGQLAQVRAEYDTRLQQVVKQAVEEEQRRHLEELKGLELERDQLKETVASLEAQLGAAAETRAAAPTTLADSFIETLEQVASREAEDRPFDVSLSRMEVEARGLLRAPTEDAPAEFVTPPPGQVNPEELSTLRMEFRISPRPPAE